MMKAYEGSGKEKSRITRPAGKVDLVARPLNSTITSTTCCRARSTRATTTCKLVCSTKKESSTALADEDLAGAIDVGAKFTDDMGDAISVGRSPSDEMGYAAGSFNIWVDFPFGAQSNLGRKARRSTRALLDWRPSRALPKSAAVSPGSLIRPVPEAKKPS